MTKKLAYFLWRQKYLSLLSISVFIHMVCYSQEHSFHKISGKVSNEKGDFLQGVSVKIKNTVLGTTTSQSGEYSLNALSSNDTLVFTYINYKEEETTINNRSVINMRLVSEAGVLNDVVVVGYGTQKKVNLTGSVSTVSGDQLAVRPVGQASSALQGLAAGVTVTQSTGRPGADAGTIRIRGIGTLNDANPLIMIDGVEGDLNSLDPNLIESISILKDAASGAIYGSRAANGVVLVSTKRAKADKVSITYNSYVGFQKPTNLPKMVNAVDHMLLTNEALINVGLAPQYTADLIQKYRTDGPSNRDLYPDNDWQKLTLTGSGIIQNHFLTVNGGSKNVRFLTSLGYFDQKGIYKVSRFRRYTLRNNADIRFSDKFNMRLDLQATAGKELDAGLGSAAIIHQMHRIPANQPSRFSNGNWGEGWNGDNPIAQSSEDGGRRKINRNSAVLNVALNYKPFDWLTAEIIAAPRYETVGNDNFEKAIRTFKLDGSTAFIVPTRSSLTRSSSESFYNNLRALLTLNKSFGDHSTKLLLGASREDFTNNTFGAGREDFLLPDYPVLSAGSQSFLSNSGTAAEWALQSFFSRLNYDYKQKYLLEFNGRYDGSSRFAPGYKYGFFPSVSAGWRVSEEPFMQSLKGTVKELKLRGSWGQLGNQNIGNYPFTSSISLGAFGMGGVIVNSAALNTMANASISWETTEMLNFGVDATLFSNLSISAEYYIKETRDILYDLDIPLTIGLAKPFQNAGVVSNKGWELGLNYRSALHKFKFDVGFILSDVVNKVVDLKGVNRTGITVSREGSAINSVYGYEAVGFFQTDAEAAAAKQFGALKAGDIKYKDQNKDGIINDADFIIIGSTIPRLTFGTNINTSYKGFGLNLFLQGVGKADGYLYQTAIMPFYNGATIQEIAKDRWTPENPNAAFPRLAFSTVNNIANSSFWLKNASYLRLKNIQLSYTVPASITKKFGVNNLRVYANGQNLFTIDKFWDGYDVEAPVGTGNVYPQLKIYNFGIDLNF